MAGLREVAKRDSETGRLYLRNGLIVAFFIRARVHEISSSLAAVFERFVQGIPKGALKWGIVSATGDEWKEVDRQAVARARAQLDPEGARKRKLTAFRFNDSAGAAAGYSFRLVGDPRDPDWPNATTLVQMTFPPDVVDEDKIEDFVALVRELAELASPTSGYCSPGFQMATFREGDAFTEAKTLATKHPGYDVQRNDMTHVHIGNKVRGARWITILGDEVAGNLGGFDELKQKLTPPIEVERLPHGVWIRAGAAPELGDRNRQIDTPLLRRVAKVLEPVTLFEEIDMLSYFANFDEELLRRWERRFLD